MAPTKRAAAAKKAAATRAAKKEAAAAVAAADEPDQGDVQAGDVQAEASTSSAAEPAAVKEEPVEDVKPAAKATRATRGAKKGKKAAVQEDTLMEEDAKPEAEQAGAASSIADERVTAFSSLPVKAEVPSAPPASEAGAPDIAGVIEAREDEDLAMDDTEPPPMDAEEVRRLRERPAEARDTSGAMPLMTASAEGIAQANTQQAREIRQAVQAEGVPPIGELAGIQEPSSAIANAEASGSLTRDERMAKMNALRKRMVSDSLFL